MNKGQATSSTSATALQPLHPPESTETYPPARDRGSKGLSTLSREDRNWLFERGLPLDVKRWENTELRIKSEFRRPSPGQMREIARLFLGGMFQQVREVTSGDRKGATKQWLAKRLDAQPFSRESGLEVMRFAEVLRRHLGLRAIPKMRKLVVNGRVPRRASDVLSNGRLTNDSGPLSLLLHEPEAWRCIATPSDKRLLHLSFADVPLRGAAFLCGEETLKRFLTERGTLSSMVRSCMKSLDVKVPAPERYVHAVLGGLVFGKEEAEEWRGVVEEYGLLNGTEWFGDIREHILSHLPRVGAAVQSGSDSGEFLGHVRHLDSLVSEEILVQLCRRRGECSTAAPVLVRRHEVIVEVAQAEAAKGQAWLRSIAVDVLEHHFGAAQGGIEVHPLRDRGKRR